jgi:hypothetical protein
MERHEQIKQLCASILDYCLALSDTEYILDTNERIDVVGYFKNKNIPDIGIEVELSSQFQHDASKLAKVPNFEKRLIVTDIPDTLSLGPDANINGKIIEIVPPPDKATDFEAKIREYTGKKGKWFNESGKQMTLEDSKVDQEKSLSDFVNEIRSQNLDVEMAKDILFKAALGGIHLGYYLQDPTGTNFHRPAHIPRELLYLKARGLILEDRPGRNYDTGKQSVYLLSKSGFDLAKRIIEERVDKNEEKLREISKKFGNSVLMISLIGKIENGGFLEDTHFLGFPYADPYSPVQLPVMGMHWNSVSRDITEKFDINPELANLTRIVADSPLFLETIRGVYKDLADARLGNETDAFTSGGDHIGIKYAVPIRALLRKLEVEEWVQSAPRDKLRAYAEWVILRAHNPSVPSTLYESFKAIGADVQDAEVLIGELADQGIASRPVNGGQSTIAIYDDKRFKDFCEVRIRELLTPILKSD